MFNKVFNWIKAIIREIDVVLLLSFDIRDDSDVVSNNLEGAMRLNTWNSCSGSQTNFVTFPTPHG